MNRKRIGQLAVALALLAAAGYGVYDYLKKHGAESTTPAAPAQVGNQVLRYAEGAPQLSYLRIEAAKALPVPLLEPLHGRIAYDDDVTAKVFSPINGRVTKIAAQAGDTVKAGQPLLWLDSPDYAQALADLRKADADRRMKALAFDRAKTLFEGEAIARKDLESAENDAAQAAAEADRARARLKNLTPDLAAGGAFALRAPVGGIVTERQANIGTEVRSDAPNPLYVVSDPTRLWAVAELMEKDLGKIKAGQDVAVEVDAFPGERFPAKVAAVGDVLDPATRRVTVRCQLPNDKRLLKPEMYARITPTTTGDDLPRVPNAALVTEGLYTYLFVETQPGVLERRRVELAYRGQNNSYVKAGLKPDERVVTTGALLLNSELSGN